MSKPYHDQKYEYQVEGLFSINFLINMNCEKYPKSQIQEMIYRRLKVLSKDIEEIIRITDKKRGKKGEVRFNE